MSNEQTSQQNKQGAIIMYIKQAEILGKTVEITVDRPLGSYHPSHRDIRYPVNYGYIEGILGGDGEWQDAYILGVDRPIEKFEGKVIAIVLRKNDNECKWIVAPCDGAFTKEEILKAISFQEKYFEIEIIC